MRRAFYSASISEFLCEAAETVTGTLSAESAQSGIPPLDSQVEAWRIQIAILKSALAGFDGSIYFEYSIPRMGKRIDVVLLLGPVILVLEFKAGEASFSLQALDQVWDYALDLKNFHEPSHRRPIVPILIPTESPSAAFHLKDTLGDGLFEPMRSSPSMLRRDFRAILDQVRGPDIERMAWESGRYSPTPTIIEAALALYANHSVVDISRSEAEAENLEKTAATLTDIIAESRRESRKSICFVTGVPGAGKTLVGLKVATDFMDPKSELYSVYLSGNGPLVRILCEALARDRVARERAGGRLLRLGKARSEARAFIQNVHHFRDEGLRDDSRPPVEHVTLFDEAQRAWDLKQTSHFMRRKRKRPGFAQSEPEFLISCVDRHPDWAVIVCLVGGGQEIHTGEAGIGEWIRALKRSYPEWRVYISPKLTDAEYGCESVLKAFGASLEYRSELHLSTSMRSFRAENISDLVKRVLDLDLEGAVQSLAQSRANYPIRLTRSLQAAKEWLRRQARGSERYGILVSSRAERLRPHAISVRIPVDPVHWFLDGKEDTRSSYYLEDVATEFHVQGLELDWACVTWDGDLRYSDRGWQHWDFVGDRWNRIRKLERQTYLKNAYRVLLTRARQGMVIVVPEGDPRDPTRDASFYDPTYEYLRKVGLEAL